MKALLYHIWARQEPEATGVCDCLFDARGGGGYSHTLPVQVSATQWGRDFEAPDLERGIHFRGVF